MDSRVNPAVDGTSGLRSTELVPHPVVSTVGGFGNEEQMKKLHGEATILAIGAANYLRGYLFSGGLYMPSFKNIYFYLIGEPLQRQWLLLAAENPTKLVTRRSLMLMLPIQ
ncbi:hypothetical protein OPV22_018117 [Ensete ventricosum]|uniref:Uncharacterized protein n=1 Tax=Ensete ventricosum TaxID=4639 RepID=A0AAV8QZJ6_ENSVE|nr:hypothetical protein OPV22_018117 [Ensete ventricosum]